MNEGPWHKLRSFVYCIVDHYGGKSCEQIEGCGQSEMFGKLCVSVLPLIVGFLLIERLGEPISEVG